MPRERDVRVDFERIEMGWVVCEREAWERIDSELAMVWALEQCSTWGEVRRLELSDSLLEEIGESLEVPHDWPARWPIDDASFSISFSNSEWYNRTLWLGRAGLDFVESAGEELLHEQMLVDAFHIADSIGGQMAYVYDERVDVVVSHLKDRGLDVRVHG